MINWIKASRWISDRKQAKRRTKTAESVESKSSASQQHSKVLGWILIYLMIKNNRVGKTLFHGPEKGLFRELKEFYKIYLNLSIFSSSFNRKKFMKPLTRFSKYSERMKLYLYLNRRAERKHSWL